MTAILKAADVNRRELQMLIRDLQRGEEEGQLRCWIEAPDGWSFDWWPGLNGDLRWCRTGRDPAALSTKDVASRSTTGRLFGPDGELRWRHIPTLGKFCCRCVFLGKVDWVNSKLNDHSSELARLAPETKRHLLWGQQTDVSPGEWIELRIPHRFRYPIHGDPRSVLIETECWCDLSRQPHFFRLCDLHAG